MIKIPSKLSSKTAKRLLGITLILLGLFFMWRSIALTMSSKLIQAYQAQSSQVFFDRTGKLVEITANKDGYYNQFSRTIPPRFAELLLKKEDKWFYWHPGVNPLSLLRDAANWILNGKRGGSSTLTQQLVKILLQNENQRTWLNKIQESAFALSLETSLSKQEILNMYLNSVYFGQSSQGLTDASWFYFNRPPESLTDAQILSLLASLNSPSQNQPKTSSNIESAKLLASQLKISIPDSAWQTLNTDGGGKAYRQNNLDFELNSLNPSCQSPCQLTLDSGLSQTVRNVLQRNLRLSALDTANNGAVIIIKLPENQLLSIIGSPDPSSQTLGSQLNMAIKPRAIGSTAKPFIYLKAFEKGARPYSLVDDTEIKYQLGTGFDFFPKNFDGQYRGLVTLHQALDNSLNIPSVQVLQFVGLENFYSFLEKDLGFKPIQPLENYQLSIVLGGLEVDPLTLAGYFTLFPQNGWLKPLSLYLSGGNNGPYYQLPMQNGISDAKQVGQTDYVQMINKILNDRDTGVDQFGIKSNLNLPYKNYALKTGTSRDYHDSWTIGYTPDFLVAVWVGNSNNTPMRQITGLSGAARIWREVMLVLYNSEYNKNTPFNFNKVVDVQIGDTLDFGLKNDNYNIARNIMLNPQLLISPHDGDKYLLQKGATVPLEASEIVTWTINGKFFAKSQKIFYPLTSPGDFTIEAKTDNGKTQKVTITVNKE